MGEWSTRAKQTCKQARAREHLLMIVRFLRSLREWGGDDKDGLLVWVLIIRWNTPQHKMQHFFAETQAVLVRLHEWRLSALNNDAYVSAKSDMLGWGMSLTPRQILSSAWPTQQQA